MWRRVPPLLDEDSAAAAATVAAAQTEAAAPSWIEALAAEECAARRCITDKFFAGLFLVVEVFAAAEKRIMHSMHRHQAGVTSLSEIGRMATVIQAAFRGYRVRHRNAIAAGQAKVKAM
ncbi:putative DNA-damage inducible protein DDI1-like protein [Trypanosoma grayi]|uniref:putative DNA-damage inducible protein DDI1-like protein n=1 Tax=Trypanosoma grayi TaxID=71804 RepID=UPI0004F47137|nr:putative DNA-damage inducible protein DDI1-like protein [Trypanosoma grayi]KEG10493.1 putative DNA-damage inducible protein DDI1-like protein [Trypanosoma grayi]